MKTIFSSRKHHYLAKVCIFLITIALVAGMVDCGGDSNGESYTLTIAVSPGGSGTTTPTGTTSHDAGSLVNIQAVANAGYEFVNWSAPAGTFGNATAATTTFTMPAQNVTVTANFVGPLDHFKCYSVLVDPINEVVNLKDQLVDITATVGYAFEFCNPADKWDGEAWTLRLNNDHHLTVYNIAYEGKPAGTWLVRVTNQFGIEQELIVQGPVALAAPTQKVVPGDHESPVGLDHFLVYYVVEGQSVNMTVSLIDQFSLELDYVTVLYPIFFANPVQKTYGDEVTEIENQMAHLVFYLISGGDASPEDSVLVHNQFDAENQTLYLGYPDKLAVPSLKLSVEPAPD